MEATIQRSGEIISKINNEDISIPTATPQEDSRKCPRKKNLKNCMEDFAIAFLKVFMKKKTLRELVLEYFFGNFTTRIPGIIAGGV